MNFRSVISIRHLLVSAAMCAAAGSASATDFDGVVRSMQANYQNDGNLYFDITPTYTNPNPSYCAYKWSGGGSFYISKDHPEFWQIYGMLVTSLTKGKHVYIAGVTGNGSAPCNLGATGYGVILLG